MVSNLYILYSKKYIFFLIVIFILIDITVYSLPIIISTWWFIKMIENSTGKHPPSLIAISNLLMNLKFLLFLRVFKYYGGRYLIITIGVAKAIFPFLLILFLIIFGFAHAFFILLRSTEDFSFDNPAPSDDKNNPWNLANTFNTINSDKTISSASTLIQTPDSNTNMFNWFGTSLLAMYLFLTGNNSFNLFLLLIILSLN